MNMRQSYAADIRAEVDRFLDDSSLIHQGQPKAVILMGGVATGKTTLRLRDYANGFVLIDAAEIFHHLSKGDDTLDFPDAFIEALELIGALLARSAVSERRNIVTEIVGSDEDAAAELIFTLKAVGYSVDAVGVTCELEEAIRRNDNRRGGVSAYYAEPFQIKWLMAACAQEQ